MKALPSDPNELALLKTQEAPDIDKPAGIDTKFHTENGNIIIERTRDVQATLDRAARFREEGKGISKSGELYHVAHIDKMVIEKYCHDIGITFHEFCVNDDHITKILNDPAYKNFRVWNGRV